MSVLGVFFIGISMCLLIGYVFLIAMAGCTCSCTDCDDDEPGEDY